MFNPLIEDLSGLKDEELSSKMNDLTKKYTIALKLGNSALAQQIIIASEALRDETLRRQRDAAKKLMDRQNKDLDDLINVG
jgi:hypothetical protein